jgi:tetratricopeptide (TPR) repeat protein
VLLHGSEFLGIVMSSSVEQEVCASCGITGGDNIKLKICTACKLVKYCSVDCQRNHRPQHKRECKKRAAEIRDDELFARPDGSHYGECPICCLPLPFDQTKWMMNSFCCKMICKGCDYANKRREGEQGLEQRCAYCREPLPRTDEQMHQNYMKRAKVNDPVALLKAGVNCQEEGDYEGAIEYYTKAAALGDIGAHQNLSNMYYTGNGVEKDLKKAVYHLEVAAIGGHPYARYNLGNHEKGVALGVVSKGDYAAALRGHQAAVDATKSQQREEAYTFFDNDK